ncbi:type III restriction-modification system endonuclease [Chitinophagaceae bacterium MMS25-I14]
MKLQFKEQQFQLQAVKAVVACFEGQPMETARFTLERSSDIIRKTKNAARGIQTLELEAEVEESIGYRNRPVRITDAQVLGNIQRVQRANDINESKQIERPAKVKLGYNLTIEMETGTGKTYTYIRTMYELHKHYGWSKFIVVVPSIAIREGAHKSFEITQDHFLEIYGHKIQPFIYNSGRPQDIESFASSPRISVMIINTQAFNASGKDARRIKMELDQFGSRRPIDIIAQTNPILVIDEPQSVEGDKTLEGMQDFNPIFTLRYSATHKNEYNKIFRLDALDAYNRKLVKKIQVKGISLKGAPGITGYLYLEQILLSANKPPLAVVEYEKRSGTSVKRVREKLKQGANLYQLSGEMPQYKHFTIQHIDGYFNKIEINGLELFAGEATGDMDEKTFRRIQIRETILSHLTKEKQLFDKGIKVLSLFFIDSVEKYRVYDAAGNEQPGEYARMFEEEYNNLRNEFLDLFKHEYNEYLLATDPGSARKAYIPGEYATYLERDDVGKVHNGYFSVDKQKRLVDPSVKRAKKDADAESDDVSAYDLIMKDKERLLDFAEPTRFIFSHSALKEGWDNPNVFQICALKHSEANIRRRQEVGRGMRLCVNNNGTRLDYDTVGEQVHEINRLTVIASESYEDFANALQSEIAATIKERPQKADVAYLTGKVVTSDNGATTRIDEETARKINKLWYKEDVLDEDDKMTDKGREMVDSNQLPIPAQLEPFRNGINNLLRATYLNEIPQADNERKNVPVSVNRNFHKKEFLELWERINLKTIYEVKFDTGKLVQDSKVRINADLEIADRRYELKEGELKETSKDELANHEGFKQTRRETRSLNTDIYTNTVYDIVGEIVNNTNLTRRTVVDILKGINPQKFLLLRKNPEEFIAKCCRLINEVKASLIINNIVYHKTEERHDAKTVFTNDKSVIRQSEILKKHIYDYLTTDSKTEARFAEALENSTEIVVYAKLPRNFFITTPVSNYSPDWAIVFDKDRVRHVYFVAETKGSESDLELREIEKLKIHCAGEHFKAISGQEVRFSKVSSYEQLLEIVQVK